MPGDPGPGEPGDPGTGEPSDVMCGSLSVPLGLPLCDPSYPPWSPDGDPANGIIWSQHNEAPVVCPAGDALFCGDPPANREVTAQGSESVTYKDSQKRMTDRRNVVKIGIYERAWTTAGATEVVFDYEVGASWDYKAVVAATEFGEGIKPDGTARFDGTLKCTTWATSTQSKITSAGGTRGLNWGGSVLVKAKYEKKSTSGASADIGVDVLKFGSDNITLTEWSVGETTKNAKKANVVSTYPIKAGEKPVEVCRAKDWVRDNLPTTETTIKQVTKTIANLVAQGWQFQVLGTKPVGCVCNAPAEVFADCKNKQFVSVNWDQWRSFPGSVMSGVQDFEPSILDECSTKYGTVNSAGRLLVEADLLRQCEAFKPTATLQTTLDNKCKAIQGTSFEYAWGHKYCRVCDKGSYSERPYSCNSEEGKKSRFNATTAISCAIQEL